VVAVLVIGLVVFIMSRSGGDQPETQAADVAAGVPVAQSLPDDAPAETEPEQAAPVEVAPPVSPLESSLTTSPLPTPEAAQADGGSGDVTPPAGTEQLVEQAKQLLPQAAEIQVSSADIKLAAMESQEWPDSSLGCPQPEQMYAQVITPGYIIMLEANGTQYEFHSDAQNTVVPCFEQADAQGAAANEPTDIRNTVDLPADAVLQFQREGGITGASEVWTVYADGRVEGPEGAAAQLDPQDLDELLAEIDSAGFFAMEPDYMPLDTCCDRITYQLTVRRSDGQQMTVRTLDAAEETPEALWTIIDEVSALLMG
jgi:hypothetical protein